MKLIVTENYDEMSKEVTEYFVQKIKDKPDAVLSFTTGKTPAGMFKLLADAVNNGLDISKCTFMNLDEYIGDKDGKYSVYRFMHEAFYDKISIKPRNIFLLNGEAKDIDKEIQRYSGILKQYHRDIQLLGLGVNGHIGANEPGTSFESTLFCAESHERTIQSTMELFNLTYEECPKKMLTMGFKEIMDTDCVILAASGRSKAEAVRKIIREGITEQCPASFLKTHKNFVFIIDKEAASLL